MWNKIAFWGSVASFLGLLVAVMQTQPAKTLQWPDAFNQINDAEGQQTLASRTFWLLRESGTTLTLGPCPGQQCINITLGKMIDGLPQMLPWMKPNPLPGIFQQVLVAGGGLGLRITQSPGFYSREGFVRMEIKKGVGHIQQTSDGPYVATLRLDKGTEVAIQTELVVIDIIVKDSELNSLRLEILISNADPITPVN